jgi:diguanylate cyclase (GGDEF)-like protein
VTASASDLAAESVEETLRAGVAPSLEQLPIPARLEPLGALIAALVGEGDVTAAAAAHTQDRERFGFAPREIVGELLCVGRVLDRHAERIARLGVDWCALLYVDRVTNDLAEQARRDPLTGVLNHLAFHTVVANEIARARRYRGRLALVLFDLDRFKETNDRDGHQEGDRLLRAFASVLAGTVRETDAVGRIGGDEFATLLLQGNERAVTAFLRRLTARLPKRIEVSTGAAYLAEGCETSEQLFALADRRLYADKTARAA